MRWISPAYSDDQRLHAEFQRLLAEHRQAWLGAGHFLVLSPDLKIVPFPKDEHRFFYRPEDVRQALQHALAAFEKLPEAQRKPKLSDQERKLLDENLLLDPPDDALIVRTFHRVLKDDGHGGLIPDPEKQWSSVPASDVVWVPPAEFKRLIVDKPQPGQRFPFPEHLRNRLIRYGFHPFYMLENSVNYWVGFNPRHQREANWTVHVKDVADQKVVMEVTGPLRIEAELAEIVGENQLSQLSDPARTHAENLEFLKNQSTGGFDGTVRGILEYDSVGKKFTRFDMVAVGDYWGAGTHNRLRPRTPVGFALELPAGEQAADFTHPERIRRKYDFAKYLAPIE